MVDYPLWLQQISDVSFEQGEPFIEQLLYEQLPFSNLSVRFGSSSSQTIVSLIEVPTSLSQHLLLSGGGPNPDAIMFFNPNFAWNFEGVGTSTDFETILIHETLHALGFRSRLDSQSLDNPSRVGSLDPFRFSGGPNTLITDNTLCCSVRELRYNTPAVYGYLLNNSDGSRPASVPPSLGEPFQASHWLFNAGNPTGIMDPVGTSIADRLGCVFPTRADMRMFDVIGWDVSPDSFGGGPFVPPEPQFPVTHGYYASGTISFQWDRTNTPGPISLYIWNGSTPIGTPVLSKTSLPGTTYALTAAEALADAAQYSWRMTSEAYNGYGITPVQTFTVCYANCDGSTGTPALSASDFVCFLGKFRANDPYANCDGSTGSPALTAADFVCFLNKFRAGCP